MKQILIFLLVLFLSTNLVLAQYNDYSLKDYVNPDYKRQSLDFDFGGNVGNYSLKQKASRPYYVYHSDNKGVNMNGLISIDYNRIKNSIRTQNSTYAGLSFGGQYDDYHYSYSYESQGGNPFDYDILNRRKEYDIRLYVNHNGYYYTNNKKFLLFAPSASLSYSHLNNKSDNETDESYNASDAVLLTDGSFSLGVGKGRIEEVGDARQAVYILQELQKQGVLKKDLSQEEINEMAQLITKVKYKRQFDSRIRLIQEITSIDSLLIEKGYVEKEHSAAYFTTLYDNWIYSRINRSSGNRFTLGVRPNIYYRNEKTKTVYINRDNYTVKDTTKNFNYGVDLYAGYESEKPINLHWQRSFSTDYSIGWAGSDYPQHEASYITALSVAYGIAYYPNSRTSIRCNVSERIDYGFKNRQITSTTSLNFGMYYYFSPQLRLEVYYGLGFNYQHIDDKDDDWTSTSRYKYPANDLSVKLTYSLF